MDDIEINKAFVTRRLKQIVGGGEGGVGYTPHFCTQAAQSLLRMGVRESVHDSVNLRAHRNFFLPVSWGFTEKGSGKGTMIYQNPTKC